MQKRPGIGAVAIALVLSALCACGLSASPVSSSASPSATTGTAPRTTAVSALSVLATLRVAPDGPISGYTRAKFGDAWTDNNDDLDGHNGCDTRDDILRRDLTAITVKADTHGCTVATGSLTDPYKANTTIAFVRGPQSAIVQIDHVVPLGNAWETGAAGLTARVRQNLGNDPLNLLAVDGSSNEAKGDSDAAHWLPPDVSYRCAYVARQIAVKAKYGLWVTPAERTAMAVVLGGCASQRLPEATP